MKRIFVDPASKACGWALFEGREYRCGGAIYHNVGTGDRSAFINLARIQDDFVELFTEQDVEEIHIERLVTRTHRYTHWSVGVIGAAAASCGIPADADIAIGSWQKPVDWKNERKLWEERGYESQDHYAAYLMGSYYVNSLCGSS